MRNSPLTRNSYWVDKFGHLVLNFFGPMVKNIQLYGFYLLGRPVWV